MTDREERQHVIEVLQNMVDWMEAANLISSKPERIEAVKYAIASIETDLKYDLMYEETSEQADKPITKNCESCRYYGSHHEVCNYCYKCSLWTEQEPTTKNDLALIHTWGLDEGIRCAMCTNSIKSDRGCDGGCVVNNAMYKEVMDVIENHIVDTDKMVEPTTKNDLGVDWDELKRKIFMEVDGGTDGNWLRYGDVCDNISDSIDDFKANLTSVTPQEPRKGHWIDDTRLGYHVSICSNCNWRGHGDTNLIYKPKYCPNCGADMRGEEE